MGDEKKLIKIILLGDSSVGKTTIFQRFIDNHLEKNSFATVGVEFKLKYYNYHNKNYSIQVFDTAGQERFRSITQAYYKMGQGFFIIFDISNEDSLKSVPYWIDSIYDKVIENNNIIILGNKSDLQVQIADNVIKQTLDKYKKIKFIKTSALNNKNINKAFEEMIDLCEQGNTMENNKKLNEIIKKDNKVSCC